MVSLAGFFFLSGRKADGYVTGGMTGFYKIAYAKRLKRTENLPLRFVVMWKLLFVNDLTSHRQKNVVVLT